MSEAMSEAMSEEMMGNNGSVDRLTFWRNWFEAIRFKPDGERLEKYDSIMNYVFEGTEPPKPTPENPASANAYEIVNFVKAAIVKSQAQRANGSKAKAKRSQRKAKRSQHEANTKPNEANTKQEQEQEQVKDKDKEQDASSSARGKKKPTIEQFISGGFVAGVPEDFCREFYRELEANGWLDANGSHIGNWRMYLRRAYLDKLQKFPAPRGEESVGSPFSTCPCPGVNEEL